MKAVTLPATSVVRASPMNMTVEKATLKVTDGFDSDLDKEKSNMVLSVNEMEAAWQRLEDEVNARGADGKAFVEAMKDYYSITFLPWHDASN